MFPLADFQIILSPKTIIAMMANSGDGTRTEGALVDCNKIMKILKIHQKTQSSKATTTLSSLTLSQL